MLTSEALEILHLKAPFELSTLKSAYRDQLLARHPDKQYLPSSQPESAVTVQDVKDAYTHLLALHAKESKARGDRIVDLDEFTFNEEDETWSLDCRCGHAYLVREEDLEAGRDVVGCDGCSLFVRITYQEVDEDETVPP